jgi:tetratricopeptide (TPR) repeat protein
MAKEKKEDTIVNVQEVYTRTEHFVDRHRTSLFIALGVIAALFAGFFAWQYLYKNPRELEAANALWKVQQWIEIDSTALALSGDGEYDGLDAIIENYGGTKSGKLAHYYSGVIARDAGDYQAALDHFLEADFCDEAVGILAIGNVGDMYVQLGDMENAAKWLEKASHEASESDSRDFLGPIYILKGAKVYMELGKNDKAIKMLQHLTDDFDSKSQEYGEAAKLLAMLKAQG